MDQQNKLSVPAAIIVAGLIIAGAIFWTRGEVDSEKNAANNKNDSPSSAEINLPPISVNDHIKGNPDAAVILVEYSDLECPACQFFQPILQQAIEEYGKDGKLAWVFRHFPLKELHSRAAKEAEAAECVYELGGNTKFWNYIDKIFEISPTNNRLDPAELPKIATEMGIDKTKFETCLGSGKYGKLIDESIAGGTKAGVNGTPTTYLAIKNALSKDSADRIREKTANFVGERGEPIVTVSKNGKVVMISAAFQYQGLKTILDAVLAEVK